MPAKTVKLKIVGVPKDYATLPFGRQIDYRHTIADFQATAKRGWISIKRTTAAKAFREFISMNSVTEYYASYFDQADYRDDSVEIFYK